MESKTFYFFKEISKIPRESGNETGVADFICKFAEERNLWYIRDKYNNVIIKKKTTDKPPIILQAHLDMVCEKSDSVKFDFETDSIQIYEKDGFFTANATTLGADNGIGVAQILNILDSNLKVNIEAVFTVEEETTMKGAENIDVSVLSGKQMINLDGFEKDTIITESAGFFDIILKTKYTFNNSNNLNIYRIELKGMDGGHSGFDIDKDRGNSIIELAKVLKKFDNIEIATFSGGTKFNVIPSQAECIFASSIEFDDIVKIVENAKNQLKLKYKNLDLEIEKVENVVSMLSKQDSNHFIDSILDFKHGVFFKNEDGKVTTSANLGVVNLSENIIKIGVRCSRKEEEKFIIEYLKNYSNTNKFEFNISGFQPGFQTDKHSKLVEQLCKAYGKSFEYSKLNLTPVHITVEAGFFKQKIPDLDVAIISPNIIGAHTIEERVEIKSVLECDKWLENFLVELD